MRRLVAALAVWIAALAAPAGAEVRLLMVEAPGCIWCARWNAEVGDAYAKTAEGRVAPLLRAQKGALPEGLALASAPVITPTFVLLSGGAEVGRIEGYPGEHFFWPLLARLIEKLPADEREDEGS